MRNLLVCGAAIVWASLSGCSALTSASDFANHPPPRGLLVAPPAIPRGESVAKVVVYRDGTFAGSANHRWLSFDKHLIATLLPLQRVEFEVIPGRHELGAHCFAWGEWKEQLITVDARAGTTVRYLLSKCSEIAELSESGAALWSGNKLVKVGP